MNFLRTKIGNSCNHKTFTFCSISSLKKEKNAFHKKLKTTTLKSKIFTCTIPVLNYVKTLALRKQEESNQAKFTLNRCCFKNTRILLTFLHRSYVFTYQSLIRLATSNVLTLTQYANCETHGLVLPEQPRSSSKTSFCSTAALRFRQTSGRQP